MFEHSRGQELAANKINWIRILQGWAMLWVVIGHAPLLSIDDFSQPSYVFRLYDIAYSFHMPLFIFISGYLFRMTRIERPMPYRKMMIDKLQRLGIPFVVFTILAMAVKSFFPADMARPTTFSVKTFVNAVLFPGDGPLGELWFVATLMWYFAMRPLWKVEGWGRYIVISVSALLFFLPDLPIRNFLCYRSVLHYAIFFCLGAIVRAEKISSRMFRRYMLVMAIASLVGSQFIGGGIFSLLEMIVPVIGIIASIIIARIADKYMPQILSSFRDYSYQIYLMGIFAQIAVKMLYKHDFIPYYLPGYVLCIFAGVYLPVLVSIVIRKLNNKYLKLCIGLK